MLHFKVLKWDRLELWERQREGGSREGGRKRSRAHKFCYLRPPAPELPPPLPLNFQRYQKVQNRIRIRILYSEKYFGFSFFNTRGTLPLSLSLSYHLSFSWGCVEKMCNSSGGKFEIVFPCATLSLFLCLSVPLSLSLFFPTVQNVQHYSFYNKNTVCINA